MDIRLQEYKKNRLKGLGIEASAVKAGFSVSYARSKSWKIEEKANISLKESFARRGLTDEKLIEHALAGLEANKVISCNVISPSGEGMSDAHGTTKDFIDVPDWANRHKYFQTILELTKRIDNKQAGSMNIGDMTIIIKRAPDVSKSSQGDIIDIKKGDSTITFQRPNLAAV